MRKTRLASAVVIAAGVLAGSRAQCPITAEERAGGQATAMDRVSEGYVKLVLALGAHDADYVDAYYGPPAWKTEAGATKLSLDQISSRAKTMLDELGGAPARGDEMERLRHQYLERQLSALAARVRMLQ